jgi:hypothetical protein
MSSKRQQTMAKMARERAVREKRERKLEKKQALAAQKKARAEAGLPPLTPDELYGPLETEESYPAT